MELSHRDAIIDFCLAPLSLNANMPATHEVRRRFDHVIKTFQTKLVQQVSVDFASMPPLVINEAAHGYED